VYVISDSNVGHDFTNVITILENSVLELVLFHGDLVPKRDVLQYCHGCLLLTVHIQTLGCFALLDIDRRHTYGVGFFMYQKLNHFYPFLKDRLPVMASLLLIPDPQAAEADWKVPLKVPVN
jgi:hypothetical protein